jgi:cAMP-binding proteins - catabolite gene activator and regulatory subunit of cAMP-dependent protein kinases
MYKLDTIIEIIENANNIKLLKEKILPIYEQMTYCKREKNQIISQIGDVNKNLYVLLSGIIRLYYIDTDGNDITRFFGTKGCVSGGITEYLPYVVETLEDCEFLMIDWEKAKSLVGEDVYWIKIWNKLLQNSIRYKIYRESCFLTESATERYIDFRRMYPKLEEQVNQSYIASYLGITPVSLSRIRRTIKEEK